MSDKKVILFNPRSAKWKHRIPNSILQVGASIYGKFEFVFIDGNLEEDPWSTIHKYLSTGEFNCFGVTVMPGPQLKEAIPFSRDVKKLFPDVSVVWGGYFASNQHRVALESKYVDVVINGPGDQAFPSLLEVLGDVSKYPEIDNLIYVGDYGITKNKTEKLLKQDLLPQLPYSFLNEFYPLDDYLAKTFLGERTLAYHSSIGCPFTCSFCAVVPIYNAKWQGKSAENMYQDVKWLKDNYGLDSIEFHDNNFFTSKKRVVEFSKLILDEGISWWGEGRIDTVDKYSDEELQLMSDAGCKMIFFGAESGSDEILKQMDKGGSQTAAQIKSFAKRLEGFNIIPEYSFVLGMPAETEEQVYRQVNSDIKFIKEVKAINPNTEIIIYLYSPVPTEGSELYDRITKAGFKFPSHLDDWLNPVWENFDLRKNPITPWLTPKIVDRIMNFEVVLNGYHPTATDIRIKGLKKGLMRGVSYMRFKTGVYKFPYEIKAMHKLWKYRQPEIEGFYSE